jgi:uncharacterized protein YdeI (BOF family)
MKIFSAYKMVYGAMLSAILFGGCTAKQSVMHSDNVGKSNIITLVAVQKMKPSTSVIAQGTMVEKCPVAGCWFMLHDKTGTIKVDLKATKQNVVNIPLNSEVTVHGKVAQNGSQKMIQAVSATF